MPLVLLPWEYSTSNFPGESSFMTSQGVQTMSGWQASQGQDGSQDSELSAILSGPLSS